MFVAPLFFSFFHGAEEYILVEQSIAICLIIVPCLLLGLTASYTQWNLKYKIKRYNGLYRSYALSVSLIVYVVGFIYLVFDDIAKSMIFFILSTVIVTRLFSQPFKINEMAGWSSFLDALPYILLIALSLLLLLGNFSYQIYAILVLSVIVLIWFKSRRIIPGSTICLSGINEYVVFGISSTILSAFITLVAMTPRALAPDFMGETTEDLYFGMRVALALVLTYQFIAIKYYKKIYDLDKRNIAIISNYYALFLIILLTGCSILNQYYGDVVQIYSFSLVFTLLWILSSVYEIQVIKNKKIKKFIAISALPVGLCLIGLYLSLSVNFLLLSFFAILFICIAQFFTLTHGSGFRVKSSILFFITGTLGVMAFYNG